MIRAAFLLALASPAGAFELAFPADCSLGKTCYIQQYVDHDAGPGAKDFSCGGLSYQGHDGTDIALPSVAAMAAGVGVLAAAAGTVKGVRDGIADFAPVIPGKECGNGVLVDHGDGWQTQYCHMKQGSVAVQMGETVGPGSVLGQIGQSGMAEFPHLHLAVRQNGQNLDPFAPDTMTSCGASADDLWQAPIAYQPGRLLSVGLADAVPDYAAIRAGLTSPDLPATAPALVIWTYLFGARPGDTILFEITGPEGRVIAERVVLEKAQALAFRAVGKRLKTAAWPTGRYQGEAVLLRDGVELGRDSLAITIEP